MSQLPNEQGGKTSGSHTPGSKSPAIRLAPVEGEDFSTRPIGTAGERRKSVEDSPRSAENSPSALGNVFGFLLLIVGGMLAVLPEGTWGEWLARLGSPWSAESCRWVLAGVLIVTSVSFLRTKPITVLFVAALVLLTGYTTNVLLMGEPSAKLDKWADAAVAGRFLVLLSIAAAYLLHLGREARQPMARGVFALAIIALASHALVAGWIEGGLAWAAPKFGPNGQGVIDQWGQEFAWGCAIVLTAIGVASSRTRAIHFMNAVLLFCLAIYCIRTGMSREVLFPTLDASLTEVSIKNVTLWRWVAAGELILLSVVLLHQALGIGGLCVAWAIAWMIGGVSIYREFGSLEFTRVVSRALAGSMGRDAAPQTPGVNPLSNMGLPVASDSNSQDRPETERTSRTAAQANGAAQRTQPQAQPTGPNTAAMQVVDRQLIVREVTRQVWLLLTSILAGLIGITGARMMLRSFGLRVLLFVLFWISAALGLVYLGLQIRNFRDATWIVEWTQSRLHSQACWFAFVLTMAIAGCWALLDNQRKETWLHVTVYATFIGTILSLVGVSLLIGFGGFSGLPVWTYIAIAAGQSSLAWIVLMHMSMRARDEGRVTSLL